MARFGYCQGHAWIGLTIMAGLSPLAALADGGPPAYGGPSVFVPFAPATSGAATTPYAPTQGGSPAMEIAFCGRTVPVKFTMDTGSTGIIASPDLFTPCTADQAGQPGEMIYSSSGRVEKGNWYRADVTLFDPASHQPLAVANVPVLQVTQVVCGANARDCTPNPTPTGVAMMGVGFGRYSTQQPQSKTNVNPFLNVTQVATSATGALQPLPSSWNTGYVVTKAGAALGLSAANTAGARWVKLSQTLPPAPPVTVLPEWSMAPAELVINGTSLGIGAALMDTGVGIGYLGPKPAVQGVACGSSQCLPNGTTVAVYLPSKAAAISQFGFTVATPATSLQPGGGVVMVGDPTPFYNTSRTYYAGFSMAYDAVNGWAGLIPAP